jgi:hypothetical protein
MQHETFTCYDVGGSDKLHNYRRSSSSPGGQGVHKCSLACDSELGLKEMKRVS